MKYQEALHSQRDTIQWLQEQGEVKVIKAEVDPVLEIGAINKAFDDGPAFLAENIKGYPHARYIANLWGRPERVAKILGVDGFKDVKFKIRDAVNKPIPPKVVDKAPCQEVFISKEEFDAFQLFPMLKHSERDGGRFFGSGANYISGKYCEWGSQLALYRMSFRGKDYASINMVPGGHGDQIADKFSKEKIPCTVNICPPPMVEYLAWGSFIPMVFPYVDEVGVAGRLQGFPVEIVKAKTVDAYAIANSEWVIEGYIVPYERVWETEEAEKIGRQGVAPFHPEWARYLGRAYRGRKFEVTAVTHRQDRPLYFVPFFGSNWGNLGCLLASFLEIGERVAPGFVVDVNCFLGLTVWSGIVYQVRKRRRSDEGLQRNLLQAAMGAVRGLRLAMVVDEDINVYLPEDLFYALTTRVNPREDIIFGGGARGHSYQPTERMQAGEQAGITRPVSVFEGGIGIDATVPLYGREAYERGRYNVEKMDFRKWFTEQEIKEMKAMQREYFHWLGETGYA